LNLDEIFQKVRVLLLEAIDEGEVEINLDSTIEDIQDMTSLVYIQWVSAVEEEMGVSFSTREHEEFKTVEQVCHSIHSKI